ncbi:hypothetical protein SKAU_G00343220 [Synaphobranchus kaupii]|uniref:Uncharacterized protein n=1 Tax=Synaphobranchus kaupii TaxID=118154 RepID=A0A9Q1IHG5_SYNKA|nr:hypothetical protein SKAU_G00343220 [Synaphobranchus kaupii]
MAGAKERSTTCSSKCAFAKPTDYAGNRENGSLYECVDGTASFPLFERDPEKRIVICPRGIEVLRSLREMGGGGGRGLVTRRRSFATPPPSLRFLRCADRHPDERPPGELFPGFYFWGQKTDPVTHQSGAVGPS